MAPCDLLDHPLIRKHFADPGPGENTRCSRAEVALRVLEAAQAPVEYGEAILYCNGVVTEDFWRVKERITGYHPFHLKIREVKK